MAFRNIVKNVFEYRVS